MTLWHRSPVAVKIHVELDHSVVRLPTRQGERELVVDLYLPEGKPGPRPLVIYIHGGGWQDGTQYRPPFKPRLFDNAIAVAAITYRFSQESPFPACLQDCKLMVRWLRAHSGEYGLDPERFGAWGISAGGHLASLLGTTAGHPEFEGDGGWDDFSSDVRAVCNCCGPTDLWRTAIDPVPGMGMIELCSNLIGAPLHANEEKARTASPLTYASPKSVAHLFIHGMEDPIVPDYHSRTLHAAFQRFGVPSEMLLLPGTGHDLPPDALDQPVRAFFLKNLLG